jgi:uncharacterized protein YceH (UPF0502 family)
MASLGSLDEVERVLDTLTDRGYVRRLERRPGQKEDRFEQLLGSDPPADTAPPSPVESVVPAPAVDRDGDLEARVAALEAEVADLRQQLSELRRESSAVV